MKDKPLKARVLSTGQLVKVVVEENIKTFNIYKDVKTEQYYYTDELSFEEPKHMVQFGLSIGRVGMFLFAREYFKYNVWYIIPGFAVSGVNGYDRYVDAELKILFFGFGIRFIWVKKK